MPQVIHCCCYAVQKLLQQPYCVLACEAEQVDLSMCSARVLLVSGDMLKVSGAMVHLGRELLQV